MPSEAPFGSGNPVPPVRQHQPHRTHPARCPLLAGSPFTHPPPARTLPPHFLADRSHPANRKQVRQTLVCTSTNIRTEKTGTRPRHRCRHCRRIDRPRLSITRHFRYRIGSPKSRSSRQRQPARAALRQNLAARHRTDRTAACRLRLHQTPARTHPARLRHSWGGNGIIHLNYSRTEQQRNHELGLQKHHNHLYRSITSAEAEKIAGIPLNTPYAEPLCGLYWQHGVWLNPPAFVRTLLSHPLIELYENTTLTGISHDGEKWIASTPNGTFTATHIIYCTGAHSPCLPETNLAALPLRQIRGQTGLTPSTPFSEQLRCAVSGESYISPSWHGLHCYGASFIPNSSNTGWNEAEEASNRQALAHLNPALAESLFAANPNPQKHQGHAAIRCDSPDHLPVVGALGDIAAMRQTYAKLALDKNYRIDTTCPYLPNAYTNTAHGTRGLATAPICAAAVAAEILGLPHLFSQRLRHALHPNRTVIRAIVRRQNLIP